MCTYATVSIVNGKLAVLLDCDNSKMNFEIPTLFSREDVCVLAASNDVNKLPRNNGEPVGEVVKTYTNATDFRLVARLGMLTMTNNISDVVLVTKDAPLTRAIHDICSIYHINCERYPNIAQALVNKRFMEALQYDPLHW